MKATLTLEDGSSFSGEAPGVSGEKCGEVILNTAVIGYQEMLTDPANAGKILALTYPLIGNYGVAPKFNESNRCLLSGLAIKEKSRIYSNWQARASFDKFIKDQGLLVISEIDTRTLAVHLRDKGEMLGIISTLNQDTQKLLSRIESFKKKNVKDYISKISVRKPTLLGKVKSKYRIAVLDLGITASVIRQLETLGLSVYVFPYNTKPEEILSIKPAGLIISNGPEADVVVKEVVNNIKNLVKKVPLLGISTGHQILASALGAKIKKMPLGHRGLNYPMSKPDSYKSEITVQNHSYVVDAASLKNIKGIKITGYNLNDSSVEEMESKSLKLIGAQYYPVSPGFNEVNDVFKRFLKMIKEN
jgi:carbamoyl-phosphate synthase small subunit